VATHEARFVETLKAQHGAFVDMASLGGNIEQKVGNKLPKGHKGV